VDGECRRFPGLHGPENRPKGMNAADCDDHAQTTRQDGQVEALNDVVRHVDSIAILSNGSYWVRWHPGTGPR